MANETIADTIAQLSATKTAIFAALATLGVPTPETPKLDQVPNLLKSIPSVDVSAYTAAWTRQNIEHLVTPPGVTKIGFYVFHAATFIESVVLSEGITSVSGYAFQYCSNLGTVSFPSTLQSIGDHAFENCPIATLNLPASLTTIESYAFAKCTNLKTIIIRSPNIAIGIDAFQSCPSGCDIQFIARTMNQVKGMQSYNSWGFSIGTPIKCSDGTLYYRQ